MTHRVISRAVELVDEATSSGRLAAAAIGFRDRSGYSETHVSGVRRTDIASSEPVTLDDWWDLASLTKVLVTTRQFLRLCESGELDLDDSLADHLPDLCQVMPTAPVRKLRVRKLLSHSTGLPAWHPLYTETSGPEQMRARLLQTNWPLGQAVYSDIGFLLLGLVIERVTAAPFSDWVLDDGLSFRPDPLNVVATEACPWRGHMLVGETHDENAAALGGAAGHAGLFGTLEGVLGQLGRLLEGKWVSRPSRLAMLSPHSELSSGARYGLGWSLVPKPESQERWSGGALCGPASYGHLGFTGVGMWVDPDAGYGWCLLTNRIHPTRHRESGVMDLRRRIGNVIANGV